MHITLIFPKLIYSHSKARPQHSTVALANLGVDFSVLFVSAGFGMVYCLRDLGMQHFDKWSICLHTDVVFILEDYKRIMNTSSRVDRRLQQQQRDKAAFSQ